MARRDCLVVYSAEGTSDFGAGALIFVVSLATASRTRHYCFTASFYCVPISETCLAAYWSFIIFAKFSFSCSPGTSMNVSVFLSQ